VPGLARQLVELQLLHALDGCERVGQVHLVGEEQDRDLLARELLVLNELLKLVLPHIKESSSVPHKTASHSLYV
jgi:hypothetical protein